MCLVQRSIRRQPRRQVWVCYERHAERHRICLARRQGSVGAGLVEAFVDDIGATECRLDQRADAVVSFLLPRADKGNAAFTQFARHVGEGLGAVGIAHVMGIGTWCQVHADATWAPHVDSCIGHFQQQPRTVFQRAAVLVGTLVGAALQELVQQVAIGAVDFHAVETGGLGILGSAAVGLDDVGDLFGFQGARGRVLAQRAHQADVAFGLDRAGRYGQFAIEVAGVGDTANVPQLQENAPASAVHGLGDVMPAAHLLVVPDAGRVGVADAHRADRCRFAENQAGTGALHVVFGHQRIGHTAFIGTAAGQRGHDDAVGQLYVAQLDRIEKRGHNGYLPCQSAWRSCSRNASMVASLRLKKCHWPTFWLLIRPARCKVAR